MYKTKLRDSLASLRQQAQYVYLGWWEFRVSFANTYEEVEREQVQ